MKDRLDNPVLLLLGRKYGGAERVTEGLLRANWPSTTVRWLGGDESGIAKTVRASMVLGKCLALCMALRSTPKKQLVVTTHSKLSVMMGLLKRVGLLPANTPLVVRESTRIFERLSGRGLAVRRFLYKQSYPMATAIICQTSEMARQLVGNVGGGIMERIVVISNLIDTERIERLASEEPDHWIPDRPYMISVGRLIPEKGIDVLLRAFLELRKSVSMDLVIVGDGPLREELEALSKDLGLAEAVRFVGFQANPYAAIRMASTAVISSRIEGFPNTLLEYMLLCRKVVSTRCTDGLDALPGVIVCGAGSVEALSEALSKAVNDKSSPAGSMQEYIRRTRSPAAAGALLVGALRRRGLVV